MPGGKVAWITGGGSGIGLAGGIELARAGVHVVISGRSHDTLAAAEKQIKAVGSCEAIALDVGSKQAVAKAAERIGRVDILVNSAGINDPKRNFFNVSTDAWDRIVGINLSGMFYCVHAVLPGMRSRKDGVIINVSSWAGRYDTQFTGAAYNASKFGVGALTATLNMEEGANGIRACVVCPGEVATPILKTRPVPPSAEEMAKMVQPEDMGRVIRFIAETPPHVVLNEIVVSPAWNRIYLGGSDMKRGAE